MTLIFLSYFLGKSQHFPFSMLSAKQGNNWYHFDNVSLVWRGSWLGIEPGPLKRVQYVASHGMLNEMCVHAGWALCRYTFKNL